MIRLPIVLVLLAVAFTACSSAEDADPPAPAAEPTTGPSVDPTTTTTVSLPTAAAEDTSGDQTPPVGTNGIALDADGHAWIADLEGDQVIQVDLTTGELLRRFPTPADAGPDDVAIDGSGRVFWTGFRSGQVGRIDPSDGRHVIVADVPPGANPIAFSPDGRLFVGLAVTADGLYEIDPEGVTEPRLMSAELGNVNGFVVAADGMIHGPRATGELVRIDHESGEVLAVLATDLGFGAAVREQEAGILWWLAMSPSPRLIRIDVPPGASEGEPGTVLEIDSPIIDNFAISDQGEALVTTFNRPVVLRVDLVSGESTEIALGAAG